MYRSSLLLAIAFALLVGCSGPSPEAPSDLIVEAPELTRLRNEQGEGAMDRYQNRKLSVRGTVKEVVTNPDGEPVIVMHGHTNNSEFRCVVEGKNSLPEDVKPGVSLVVSGDKLLAGTAIVSLWNCEVQRR